MHEERMKKKETDTYYLVLCGRLAPYLERFERNSGDAFTAAPVQSSCHALNVRLNEELTRYDTQSET